MPLNENVIKIIEESLAEAKAELAAVEKSSYQGALKRERITALTQQINKAERKLATEKASS